MAVVMIIQQADGGAVLEQLGKLDHRAEASRRCAHHGGRTGPRRRRPDQDPERAQVFDQLGTLVLGLIIGGVAGGGGHGDAVLVTGVLRIRPVKDGKFSEADAVRGVHGVIPVFHAEVGGPSGILHGLLLDGLPLYPRADFQGDGFGLLGQQGEALGSELERARCRRCRDRSRWPCPAGAP